MNDQDLLDNLNSKAIEIAKGFGYKLDHTKESIRTVDHILEDLHQEFLRTKSSVGFDGIALEFGAYIIKTVQNTVPGVSWNRDHSEIGERTFPLYLADQSAVFPVGWCKKHLLHGESESVLTKFYALI